MSAMNYFLCIDAYNMIKKTLLYAFSMVECEKKKFSLRQILMCHAISEINCDWYAPSSIITMLKCSRYALRDRLNLMSYEIFFLLFLTHYFSIALLNHTAFFVYGFIKSFHYDVVSINSCTNNLKLINLKCL